MLGYLGVHQSLSVVMCLLAEVAQLSSCLVCDMFKIHFFVQILGEKGSYAHVRAMLMFVGDRQLCT